MNKIVDKSPNKIKDLKDSALLFDNLKLYLNRLKQLNEDWKVIIKRADDGQISDAKYNKIYGKLKKEWTYCLNFYTEKFAFISAIEELVDVYSVGWIKRSEIDPNFVPTEKEEKDLNKIIEFSKSYKNLLEKVKLIIEHILINYIIQYLLLLLDLMKK